MMSYNEANGRLLEQQNCSNCEEVMPCIPVYMRPLTVPCQNMLLGYPLLMGMEASKLQDSSELRLQKASVFGRRCADCGNIIKESVGERCVWCTIVKKLNEEPSTTGVECENKGRGCPYRLTGNKSIAVHQNHFCKYRDISCPFCQQKLPSVTSRADHLAQNHGTVLTAVVNDDLATIDFAIQPYYGWYIYYIHVRNLVIYMEMHYESTKLISFYPVVASDNRGGDFMTINATITNPNTKQALISQHFPSTNTIHDWELIKLDLSSLNLLNRAKLDVKLIINAKK